MFFRKMLFLKNLIVLLQSVLKFRVIKLLFETFFISFIRRYSLINIKNGFFQEAALFS